MVENTPVKYTSKILKATALLDDTRTFLSFWDESLSVQENLQRIKWDNILGKASRAREESVYQEITEYIATERKSLGIGRTVKSR